MTVVSTRENITHDVEFTDEAEARRYLDERTQEGFLPLGIGVVPYHRYDGDHESVTWIVRVEKQTYNGKTTPAYHTGDHVVWAGEPGWSPVEGTVSEAYGHGLKLQRPSGGTFECRDYEVERAS